MTECFARPVHRTQTAIKGGPLPRQNAPLPRALLGRLLAARFALRTTARIGADHFDKLAEADGRIRLAARASLGAVIARTLRPL